MKNIKHKRIKEKKNDTFDKYLLLIVKLSIGLIFIYTLFILLFFTYLYFFSKNSKDIKYFNDNNIVKKRLSGYNYIKNSNIKINNINIRVYNEKHNYLNNFMLYNNYSNLKNSIKKQYKYLNNIGLSNNFLDKQNINYINSFVYMDYNKDKTIKNFLNFYKSSNFLNGQVITVPKKIENNNKTGYNHLINLYANMLFQGDDTFIHEFGHIILGSIEKEKIIYDFYNISWNEQGGIKKNKKNCFISEYAKTNYREDFAETFAYYTKLNNNAIKKSHSKIDNKECIQEKVNIIDKIIKNNF